MLFYTNSSKCSLYVTNSFFIADRLLLNAIHFSPPNNFTCTAPSNVTHHTN